VRGGTGAARAQLQGLVVFGLGLALTSGTLWGLHALTTTPSRTAEVALLLVANAAATLLRFLLFRGWVFRPRTPSTATGGANATVEMETAR
jgi:putative flippase GtrA